MTADQSELLALKAEVERLTAKDAADPNSPWKIVQRQEEMIIKLDQEVERLREGLRDIILPIDDEQFDGEFHMDYEASIALVRRMVRALLNPTPEKT